MLFAIAATLFVELGFARDQIREVAEHEFRQLWIAASERMPPPTPLAMEAGQLIRKHGQIWIDHEFVVDAEGHPSAYKLHSIEPPEVDPRPFEAFVMLVRYRPVEGAAPTPVRLRKREHFHWPKPAAPGEEE
ncbi:MAG: hypothetical protein ACOVKS_09755 [Aquimonas sp.]